MHKYLKIVFPVLLLSGAVVNALASMITGEVLEPASLVLMAIGLLSLFGLRRLQLKPVRIRNRKRHR